MTTTNDPAVKRFLRRSLIARIATLSPAGNPDIIPLYFVAHGGRIYMGTRRDNPTVRDLLTRPDVVLLFHAERAGQPRDVLRVRGRATFSTRKRSAVAVYARFVWKYWLSWGGLRNTLSNLRKLPVDRRYKSERSANGGLIRVEPGAWEFIERPR